MKVISSVLITGATLLAGASAYNYNEDYDADLGIFARRDLDFESYDNGNDFALSVRDLSDEELINELYARRILSSLMRRVPNDPRLNMPAASQGPGSNDRETQEFPAAPNDNLGTPPPGTPPPDTPRADTPRPPPPPRTPPPATTRPNLVGREIYQRGPAEGQIGRRDNTPPQSRRGSVTSETVAQGQEGSLSSDAGSDSHNDRGEIPSISLELVEPQEQPSTNMPNVKTAQHLAAPPSAEEVLRNKRRRGDQGAASSDSDGSPPPKKLTLGSLAVRPATPDTPQAKPAAAGTSAGGRH